MMHGSVLECHFKLVITQIEMFILLNNSFSLLKCYYIVLNQKELILSPVPCL